MTGRAQGRRCGSDTESPAPTASGGHGAGLPGGRLEDHTAVWRRPARAMHSASCWPQSQPRWRSVPPGRKPKSWPGMWPASRMRCGIPQGRSWESCCAACAPNGLQGSPPSGATPPPSGKHDNKPRCAIAEPLPLHFRPAITRCGGLIPRAPDNSCIGRRPRSRESGKQRSDVCRTAPPGRLCRAPRRFRPGQRRASHSAGSDREGARAESRITPPC